MITRIYYRNTFFHLGHLKTLFDNYEYVLGSDDANSLCYVFADDRHNPLNFTCISNHLDYLGLSDRMKVISVAKNMKIIRNYTVAKIRSGNLVLISNGYVVRKCSEIFNHINKKNRSNYHLAVNGVSDGIIAFCKEGKLVFSFDYVVRVLDEHYGVTHIVQSNTGQGDGSRNICSLFCNQVEHVVHESYVINNFRYTKQGWHATNSSNPFLLTLSGMKSRNIPSEALRAFYEISREKPVVSIQLFYKTIRDYLREVAEPIEAVVKPMQVTIKNWPSKTTDFICKRVQDGKVSYKSLTNVFFVDSSLYGMNNVFNVGKTVKLHKGPLLSIDSVNMDGDQLRLVATELKLEPFPSLYQKRVDWLSSTYDSEPSLVCFYLYDGFYTGYNRIMEPEITLGYVDEEIFQNLDRFYYVFSYGYFKYDRNLTQSNGIPTFIRIIS